MTGNPDGLVSRTVCDCHCVFGLVWVCLVPEIATGKKVSRSCIYSRNTKKAPHSRPRTSRTHVRRVAEHACGDDGCRVSACEGGILRLRNLSADVRRPGCDDGGRQESPGATRRDDTCLRANMPRQRFRQVFEIPVGYAEEGSSQARRRAQGLQHERPRALFAKSRDDGRRLSGADGARRTPYQLPLQTAGFVCLGPFGAWRHLDGRDEGTAEAGTIVTVDRLERPGSDSSDHRRSTPALSRVEYLRQRDEECRRKARARVQVQHLL
jgi:hypothetical protein